MLQRRERWLFAFLLKLLAADPPALSLLAAGAADGAAFRDPEPPHARKAPRYAKVDMYRYSMAEPLWLLAARWWRAPATPLVWWSRAYEEQLVPDAPRTCTSDRTSLRERPPGGSEGGSG